MRRLIASSLIIALLILTVMMNVEAANNSSKSDYQVAINSNDESVQLEDSELIFEGAFRWRRAFCITTAVLGYGLGVAAMLAAPATGGLTFWLGFAGTRLAIAQGVSCFL